MVASMAIPMADNESGLSPQRACTGGGRQAAAAERLPRKRRMFVLIAFSPFRIKFKSAVSSSFLRRTRREVPFSSEDIDCTVRGQDERKEEAHHPPPRPSYLRLGEEITIPTFRLERFDVRSWQFRVKWGNDYRGFQIGRCTSVSTALELKREVRDLSGDEFNFSWGGSSRGSGICC